jgi:hypothetical protein
VTSAEGNEARARSNYAKALTQFEQATATVLDKYHIEMAEAKSGRATHPMNIPGTPSAPSAH